MNASSDIQILQSPQEYYDAILRGIASSHDRIILTALYFGVGELEDHILRELSKALQDESRKNLQVKFIFDFNRSSRSNFKALNGIETLRYKYPDRVKVFLFQMPTRVSFFPVDWNEILNVFHCKFCIFDSDVLISGANLSREYFASRQDRYWLFQGESTNDLNRFLKTFTSAVEPYCHEVVSATSKKLEIKPPSSIVLRKEDALKLKLELSELLKEFRLISIGCSSKTSLTPLINFAAIDLQAESSWFLEFLSSMKHATDELIELHLTSPYPNFSFKFSSLLGEYLNMQPTNGDVRHSSKLSIMLPSRSAHGFHAGEGVKSYIPDLHRSSFNQGLKTILSVPAMHYERPSNLDTDPPLQLFEFDRPGWTYHAKGMWCFCRDSKYKISRVISYVGSSNLGIRSWQRDFELGFVVTSSDPVVLQQIEAECLHLKKLSTKVALSHWFDEGVNRNSNRFLRRLVPFVSKILRSVL